MFILLPLDSPYDGIVCALNVMVCVDSDSAIFWSFYADPWKNDRVRGKHSWRVQMILSVPNVKCFVEMSQGSEETYGGG